MTFNVIEGASSEASPVGREMTRWEQLRSNVRRWLSMYVWQRVPRLVWPGQEIDVRVRFSEDPLPRGLSPDGAFIGYFDGGIYDVQRRLHQMGIEFDSGQGFGGRDWEWDWSLKGPISVSFVGRASLPERRRRPPVPSLVVNNTNVA